MRARTLLLLSLISVLGACSESPVAPVGENTGPLTTFQGTPVQGCPSVRPRTVLVDPTHDGGTWWFPQTATSGGFKPELPHQGRALAEYLRAQGYTVTELARGATMSPSDMMSHAVIIRAGYYYDANHPGYTQADLDAYVAYAGCQRTLIVLAEYLRQGVRDALADALGFPLEGNITGDIDSFTPHAITAGVTSIRYIAGSYLSGESNPAITVLGRSGGKAVMGLLADRMAKVLFIGDVNGIQTVPQPFVSNLVAWGF